MRHTWIEISREAFCHNIDQIKQLIGATQLGVVLKADAYGHGLRQMAMLADEHLSIDYIFTALTSEALAIRQAGITKRICALVCCDSSLQEVLSQDIDLVWYDAAQLHIVAEAARKAGICARVHLKIDTGMSRLGVAPDEVPNCIEMLNDYPHVKLVGVMTHLCDADNVSEDSLKFTQHQLTLFNETVTAIKNRLSYPLEVVHACASAGALFFSEHCSLVRIGESLYGAQGMVRIATNMLGYYKPAVQRTRLQAMKVSFSLRPILTWKTRIIQIKKIPEGSFVGYNRTYSTTQPTRIAVVPVGYFDGYPRALSNNASMLVKGVHVPVIGRVSMNMCTLDVSTLSDVGEGEEVIIMGDYPGLTADELAAQASTINLTLFTGLHATIHRTII